MNTDKRFSRISRDPRFKRMPKKARRVAIDSRFKSMFSDSKFKVKYSVDKRGRPVKQTSKEDLKKFYEIEKEDTNDENKPNLNIEESDSDSSGNGDVDFSDIRGGALSSSSSDEEDDFNEEGDKEIEHDWGELDKDATRKVDAVTSRLALCNMDWDKVTANDLFVLFSSFGAAVKSVKIYLSEFGKQRLVQEDLSGPVELKKENEEEFEDEEEGDPNNIEGASFHMEKLRKYQLNRMKYYYAIAEFESKEAANNIYEHCDGIEYELAATRLDLRFVPDETEFDDEPKQVATEIPMLSNYQPTVATNSALQQSTVRLTWDETNPQRLELTMRKFNKDELDNMDFKAYLATSSEEEAEEEDEEEDVEKKDEGKEFSDGNENNESKDEEDERIDKYKALLREIEVKERNEDDDQHMEISWEPALSETAEQIVKNKIEKEQEKSLTPWEKYLRDKKKKSKSKGKTENKSINDNSDIDENRDEDVESGLEKREEEDEEKEEYIPFGTDDPFFVHSDEDDGNKRRNDSSKNSKKKKRNKKRKEQDGNGDKDKDSQQRSELELLLMDDKEEKRHFNMKEIIDNEKRTKKRKKGRLGTTENADQFEIDVHDTRFSALFNSPDYILDPSDPQFKKTKAMDKIIEEKQKRRKKTHTNYENDSKDQNDDTGSKSRINPSLSALVNVVKARTQQLQRKKQFKLRS